LIAVCAYINAVTKTSLTKDTDTLAS